MTRFESGLIVFLRILLLLLLFFLLRRVYRTIKVLTARKSNEVRSGQKPSPPDARKSNWTQQDISDADFEEIP